MQESIALLGAGGKMGLRITRKLIDAGYDVRPVDSGEVGAKRLADAGIHVVDRDQAVTGAKIVILALPDNVIGDVVRSLDQQLSAGTMLLILDAAAPYAGDLPTNRPDLTYFVGHPCHPPLFSLATKTDAERTDYHGGIAPQSIVCALMQGPEEHYALGARICEAMWSPIIKTYRMSLEQRAILEPGLSEMVAMPFVDTMVEAVDECVRYGIDRDAARSGSQHHYLDSGSLAAV